MNQDAFRNLLSSAPSGRAGGPGRPPGVLGGAAPKRGKVGGGSSKALDLKELCVAEDRTAQLPSLTDQALGPHPEPPSPPSNQKLLPRHPAPSPHSSRARRPRRMASTSTAPRCGGRGSRTSISRSRSCSKTLRRGPRRMARTPRPWDRPGPFLSAAPPLSCAPSLPTDRQANARIPRRRRTALDPDQGARLQPPCGAQGRARGAGGERVRRGP